MTIRKIGPRTWRVYSERKHHNLGTFHSLKAAKNRIRQIKAFKHIPKSKRRNLK